MSDQDLINEFLRTKGATKVAPGVQALTPTDLRRAQYGDNRERKKYYFFARGEDYCEWADYIWAPTRQEAEDSFREMYPESVLLELKRA